MLGKTHNHYGCPHKWMHYRTVRLEENPASRMHPFGERAMDLSLPQVLAFSITGFLIGVVSTLCGIYLMPRRDP